mgnify:CR=1 FL=1
MKRTDHLALAEQLLDDCAYLVLAMTEADGTPYCVPLSPVRQGRELYFHCGRTGRKVDALRANPRVCLSCVGRTKVLPGKFSLEYESVQAFGTAQEVTVESERIEALRLISEKLCPADMGGFQHALDRWLPATGARYVWDTTV